MLKPTNRRWVFLFCDAWRKRLFLCFKSLKYNFMLTAVERKSYYKTTPEQPFELPVSSNNEFLLQKEQERELPIFKYLKGARLRGKEEKWFLETFGQTKINLASLYFFEITKDNFDKHLAVTKERIAKFGNNPWRYDDTFKIIYPEKEQKIRDEVRDYLFKTYQEKSKSSKEEKRNQKEKVLIRVTEIDPQYETVSQGRHSKVEFINLIIGHSANSNIPPPLELYTVNVILPVGVTKDDIFSCFQEGKDFKFQEEIIRIIEIPTEENISPRFKIARQLFEKLLSKENKKNSVKKNQIEKTLDAIDIKIQTDTHPGAYAYHHQDKLTGRIYCQDEYGDVIPVVLIFDSKEEMDDFIKNCEMKRINAKIGEVIIFEPKGGGVSASTSKIKKDQVNFINITVEGPDGKIYLFTSLDDCVNFWKQNFPEIPLIINDNISDTPQLNIESFTRLIISPPPYELSFLKLNHQETKIIYNEQKTYRFSAKPAFLIPIFLQRTERNRLEDYRYQSIDDLSKYNEVINLSDEKPKPRRLTEFSWEDTLKIPQYNKPEIIKKETNKPKEILFSYVFPEKNPKGGDGGGKLIIIESTQFSNYQNTLQNKGINDFKEDTTSSSKNKISPKDYKYFQRSFKTGTTKQTHKNHFLNESSLKRLISLQKESRFKSSVIKSRDDACDYDVMQIKKKERQYNNQNKQGKETGKGGETKKTFHWKRNYFQDITTGEEVEKNPRLPYQKIKNDGGYKKFSTPLLYKNNFEITFPLIFPDIIQPNIGSIVYVGKKNLRKRKHHLSYEIEGFYWREIQGKVINFAVNKNDQKAIRILGLFFLIVINLLIKEVNILNS